MSIYPTIITQVQSREEFMSIINNNTSIVIVKFGATWCKPCQKIKKQVESFFNSAPPDGIYMDLDIDECFDIYAFMKKNKMVSGIPALLCYGAENKTYISDLAISGTDPVQLDNFFKSCVALYKKSVQY